MEDHIENLMRTVTRHWLHATPTEFGTLALAIVVAGWFFTRFYGDR